MAIQTSLHRYRGKLGNTIGYYHKGKYCVRTMPDIVHQSPATKQSSRDFGTASKAARIIRHAIESVAWTRSDDAFQSRLNSQMIRIVGSDDRHTRGRRRVTGGALHQLTGFKVNRYASVKGIQEVVRHYDGHISVTLDTGLYKGAAHTATIEFRAIALCTDFGLGMCHTVESEIVSIPFNDRPQQVTLELPVAAGKQVIVFVEALNYNEEGYVVLNRKYCALDVVAVMPPMSAAGGSHEYHVPATVALSTGVNGLTTPVWPPG